MMTDNIVLNLFGNLLIAACGAAIAAVAYRFLKREPKRLPLERPTAQP